MLGNLNSFESSDYLQQSSPKIQDSFVLWVALQVKGSIPIFSLLQQQDLKDNTLCKWVSRREDTQIWVMPLLIPKMGFLYGYSVGGYRYCVGDPFWVWVTKWVSNILETALAALQQQQQPPWCAKLSAHYRSSPPCCSRRASREPAARAADRG